jgi:hypothetical protein
MRIGSSRRRLCGYLAAMCVRRPSGQHSSSGPRGSIALFSAASFARAEFCPVLRRRYTRFAVLG